MPGFGRRLLLVVVVAVVVASAALPTSQGFGIKFLQETGTYAEFKTTSGLKVNWTVSTGLNASLADFSFFLRSISFQGVFSTVSDPLNATGGVNWTCHDCARPASGWGVVVLQLFRIARPSASKEGANETTTTTPPPATPIPAETPDDEPLLDSTMIPERLVNASAKAAYLLTATFVDVSRPMIETRSGKVTFRGVMTRLSDGATAASDVSVVIAEPEPLSTRFVAAIIGGGGGAVIVVGWKIYTTCFEKKKPKPKQEKEAE